MLPRQGWLSAPDIEARQRLNLVYGRARDFHVPGSIAWGDPSAAAEILKQSDA
jgi:hypothetical protein